jgi:hypothetical protein
MPSRSQTISYQIRIHSPPINYYNLLPFHTTQLARLKERYEITFFFRLLHLRPLKIYNSESINLTISCNVLVGDRPTARPPPMQARTNIDGTPRERFDSKLPAFELFKTFRAFDRAARVTDCTVTWQFVQVQTEQKL